MNKGLSAGTRLLKQNLPRFRFLAMEKFSVYFSQTNAQASTSKKREIKIPRS